MLMLNAALARTAEQTVSLRQPAMATVSRTMRRLRSAAGFWRTQGGTTSSTRITDILPESLVLPTLSGESKEELLRELVDALAERFPDVDAQQLLEVLWRRERVASTAIGGGVAIPHGSVRNLQAAHAVLGRHPRGVDYDAPDGKPTTLFLLLIAPEDAGGQHLKMLARVSLMLKDPASRDRLLAAPDRAALYRQICQADESLDNLPAHRQDALSHQPVFQGMQHEDNAA